MAQTNPNTIVLKSDDNLRTMERVAGAAISPGHLVAITSTDTFVVHPTAVNPALRLFAMEQEYIGKNPTVAYGSGDTVIAADLKSGDEVYAKLAAAATAVVRGDKLTSAGDGTLKKTTTLTDYMVGIALESVDNSAGGAAVFIRVKLF